MEENLNVYENTSVISNSMILKTFFRMFLGLLATGLVAYYSYTSGLVLKVDFKVIAIAELVVVLLFSFLYRKLPALVVTALFFIYAVLNGVTMSVIFAVFDIGSIAVAFFATAGLFGGLALYGYTTKKDMSKLGSICTIALIVGLIVSVINMFLGNTIIDIAINWVILSIFVGLTAYDIWRMKREFEFAGVDSEKLYIYFAMQLYLDFINIFIRLLVLFGKNRD